MSVYIPVDLRNRLQSMDRNRCAYCQTSEANSGIPSACDHILPTAKGGKTELDNLCLACRPCNECKGDSTQGIDPLSGDIVSLFNPRVQYWYEHFEWSLDGTRIIGLTPVGRATIITLRMNNHTITSARQRWVSAGWHPPED
ncbi:MAG: HNH endonuclease [Caldilinea sp. CFX5]|nr:HNH endonuclease [Caldilinea sp. CFX5]